MNIVFQLSPLLSLSLVQSRIPCVAAIDAGRQHSRSRFDKDIHALAVRRESRKMIRVLVVEDDPSVGTAIRMILSHEGCDSVHALDAVTGMRAFESSSFDLVIVDIFMPGIDGLKAIAEFRQRAPSVPILAISGFRFRDSMGPDMDFLVMAAEAGAAVCLRKPFAREQLMAAVHASLDPAPPVLASRNRGNQEEGQLG